MFTALLTVTNKNGKIRTCCLVATKSHSQFEMALKELSNSLSLYGLKQPIIFFTDNMADRQLLMRVFPSLSAYSTPIEKYQHLPVFAIPVNIEPRICKAVSSINAAIDTILDDLSPQGNNTLVVGFDTEWNVQTGPNDRVVGSGSTAIIQIAYKSQIWIFQVRYFTSAAVVYRSNTLL